MAKETLASTSTTYKLKILTDLVAVAWSDAALANRVDLSSTGGMLIGFVHRRMVEEGQRGHVNVISWGSSKLRRVCPFQPSS